MALKQEDSKWQRSFVTVHFSILIAKKEGVKMITDTAEITEPHLISLKPNKKSYFYNLVSAQLRTHAHCKGNSDELKLEHKN